MNTVCRINLSQTFVHDCRNEGLRVCKESMLYSTTNQVQNDDLLIIDKHFLFLQLLKDKEELQQQLADAIVKTEALEQEKQKQEEDAQLLNRQLSETHENEVLLLKEELQTKSTEVVTAKTSEEQLNAQIALLVQEKQNLATECEMQKTEMTKR